jgi:LPXTG-motif cell wall-anchored protein
MFRGFFTLIALTLIAAGAFLLLRNRRQNQVQDKVEKSG